MRVHKSQGGADYYLFTIHSGMLLGEYAPDGSFIREYGYLGNKLVALSYRDPTNTEQTAYYHLDALGSPKVATDTSGNLLWKENYNPYGERKLKQANATTNKRWYTGHSEDDTGLLYTGARLYDPVIGRFLSVDPMSYWMIDKNAKEGARKFYDHSQIYVLGMKTSVAKTTVDDGSLVGGFNGYAYVLNSPFRYTDPMGLDWEYHVGTGDLWHFPAGGGAGEYVGTGYSGRGDGLNNSFYELKSNVGPIPEGTYTIGPMGDYKSELGSTLNNSMPLTPKTMPYKLSRYGFAIHGGDFVNFNSSNGCVILTESVRTRISESGDKVFRVIGGW